MRLASESPTVSIGIVRVPTQFLYTPVRTPANQEFHAVYRTYLPIETIAIALVVFSAYLGAAAVHVRVLRPVWHCSPGPTFPIRSSCLTASRVTTKEQWVEKRRPELKALFQYYMYGFAPPLLIRSNRRSSGMTPKRSTAKRP